MKHIITAVAFVLSGSIAYANPIANGSPVADRALAQVKGSGLPLAPQLWDFWVSHNQTGSPPMDIVMRTLYEGWGCGCHPPSAR